MAKFRVPLRNRLSEKILTDSFEILGAFGLALYGVVLLSTSTAPQSLLIFAPRWVIIVWGAALLSGGLGTLIGMFWSLMVEVCGLSLIAGGCLAYGLVLPLHYGVGGLAAMSFSVSFGVAAAIRAYSILISARISKEILRDSD